MGTGAPEVLTGSGDFPFCAVVPAYREEGTIGAVVRAVREQEAFVIVVDDGSDDGTAAKAAEAGAEVVRHARNRGKGASLRSGFERALELGFSRVVTLDGDGQHDPADIPRLLRAARETRAGIVVGDRLHDPRGMSRVRLGTNHLMSRVVSWLGGQRVRDTQCGLKLYDAAVVRALRLRTERFDTESEILLEAARLGVRVADLPVRCVPRAHRPSHIRVIGDTWRFLRLVVPIAVRRAAGRPLQARTRSVTVASATTSPSTRHSPS